MLSRGNMKGRRRENMYTKILKREGKGKIKSWSYRDNQNK